MFLCSACAQARGHHKLVTEIKFESQMAQNSDDSHVLYIDFHCTQYTVIAISKDIQLNQNLAANFKLD